MDRRIISFLYLLPLVVLISLPCSVKQDLKQLLNIPTEASVLVEKTNNVVCVYTSVQSEKCERKKQKLNVKNTFDQFFSCFFMSDNVSLYQCTGSDPTALSSIPIFLKCRKLII